MTPPDITTVPVWTDRSLALLGKCQSSRVGNRRYCSRSWIEKRGDIKKRKRTIYQRRGSGCIVLSPAHTGGRACRVENKCKTSPRQYVFLAKTFPRDPHLSNLRPPSSSPSAAPPSVHASLLLTQPRATDVALASRKALGGRTPRGRRRDSFFWRRWGGPRLLSRCRSTEFWWVSYSFLYFFISICLFILLKERIIRCSRNWWIVTYKHSNVSNVNRLYSIIYCVIHHPLHGNVLYMINLF